MSPSSINPSSSAAASQHSSAAIDPRAALVVLTVAISLFLLTRFLPTVYPQTFAVTVTQQANNTISQLDQARQGGSTEQRWVDTIQFAEDRRLTHARWGNTNYTNDFFLDIQGKVRVKKSGTFQFRISSDDGFRLTIGETLIGEFLRNRAFAPSIATRELSVGEYPLNLSYFQGSGPLGLVVEYAGPGETEFHLLGQSSDSLEFLEVQNP